MSLHPAMNSSRCLFALALLVAAPRPGAQEPASAPKAAAAAPAASKPPQFWFGSYPDFVVQFDPQRDEIARKIKLQNGMPWGVTLLADKRRFAVITDQQKKIEIVDIDAGAVTSVHDFAEDGVIVRVRSVMEIPGGTQW